MSCHFPSPPGSEVNRRLFLIRSSFFINIKTVRGPACKLHWPSAREYVSSSTSVSNSFQYLRYCNGGLCRLYKFSLNELATEFSCTIEIYKDKLDTRH